MAGKVIGKFMNYGYAGNYARTPDDVVMSRQLKDDSEVVPFGTAVAVNADNTYSAVAEGFTADKFGGIALRVVKQAISYEDNNETVYKAGEMMSALQRGNVTVVCKHGTPAAGGAVYVRVKANASITDTFVGGIEAMADGTNTVLLPNAKFVTGCIDANGVTEISLLTRVNP